MTCDYGTVAAGATLARTFVVALDTSFPAVVTNTASVASDEPDPDSMDNMDDEETTLDTTSPTVALLGSVGDTGDGELIACETANVEISQLLVTFDEAMSDPAGNNAPGDVTNPANYQLVVPGPDETFQTTQCASLLGDDQLVPVSSLTYDGGTTTATLDFGSNLAAGLYRVLACGLIEDEIGNPLDGDGDGTGGDDFVRSFRIDADNLLANGHFDCDLAGWIPQSTDPGEIVWAGDDYLSSGDSGSAAVINQAASTDFQIAQCADLALAGVPYTLANRYRMSLLAPASVDLTHTRAFFDAPACAGNELNSGGTTVGAGDTSGTWLPLVTEVTPPALAQSARCTFQLRTIGGDSFDARLDFLSLTIGAPPLFADDFESGDTSAWSQTVGE